MARVLLRKREARMQVQEATVRPLLRCCGGSGCLTLVVGVVVTSLVHETTRAAGRKERRAKASQSRGRSEKRVSGVARLEKTTGGSYGTETRAIEEASRRGSR